MYGVMIVDDEIAIRKGLGILIDWEDCGFCVKGEASNGLEALTLIQNGKFDVVITDIRMPNVNGLELIQHLNENNPNIKSIIISGYSDFEYARTAIIYETKNYILKPIDENILISTLCRIKKELDGETENNKYSVVYPSIEKNVNTEFIDRDLPENTNDIIRNINKYIHNFCYDDISLKSVANIFNYNAVYLGRVFKKATGMMFTDYVNCCRIEKACQLILQRRLKVYEISEMVGYKDMDYFHSIFKKLKGCTPGEYKTIHNAS